MSTSQVIIRSKLDDIIGSGKPSKDEILQISKNFIRKSSKELKIEESIILGQLMKNFKEEYLEYMQAFIELENLMDAEEEAIMKKKIPQYEKEYLYAKSGVSEITGMYRKDKYTTQAIGLHGKSGEIKIYNIKGISQFVMESDLITYIFNQFGKKVTESDLINFRKYKYKAPKYKGD